MDDICAVLRRSTSGTVLDWAESRKRYPKVADQCHLNQYIHISASALDLEFICESYIGDPPIFRCKLNFSDDDDDDTAYYQFEVKLHSNECDTSDLSSFRVICLSEGSAEGDYVIFLLIIAKVDGEWERVGGDWLFDRTPVYARNAQVAAPLKAVFGNEWYKHLARTYGTWRIR
jgi:hypothetical protein